MATLTTFVQLLVLTAGIAIDHPSPDGRPSHIQQLLTQARTQFENAPADSPSALGALGMVYQANNFNNAARQAFTRATELSPGDARWTYYLGMLAAAEGQFREAQEAFQASLDANPDYLPARVRLARVLVDQGQRDQARAMLHSVLKKNPQLAAAHADLGQLLLTAGQWPAAIDHLQQALQLQPEAVSLNTSLGMAYRGAGQRQLARETLALTGPREVRLDDPLNERLMLQSRSFNYFLSLGISAADGGDLAGGIGYLQTARDIAPDNPQVLVTLARMLEVAGELQAATEAADHALQAEPQYALALEQRGVLEEMQGRSEAAAGYYAQALDHNPDLTDARGLLANHLLRQGDFEQALVHLRQLYQGQAGNMNRLLQLAFALYEANQCAAAASLLDTQLRQQFAPDLLLVFGRITATCDDADPQLLTLALNSLRRFTAQDGDTQSGFPMKVSLAMVEMAAGFADTAIEVQQALLFAGVRDGLSDVAMQGLKDNLAAYQAGRRAQRPWSQQHPLIYPPLLTPGDR